MNPYADQNAIDVGLHELWGQADLLGNTWWASQFSRERDWHGGKLTTNHFSDSLGSERVFVTADSSIRVTEP